MNASKHQKLGWKKNHGSKSSSQMYEDNLPFLILVYLFGSSLRLFIPFYLSMFLLSPFFCSNFYFSVLLILFIQILLAWVIAVGESEYFSFNFIIVLMFSFKLKLKLKTETDQCWQLKRICWCWLDNFSQTANAAPNYRLRL